MDSIINLALANGRVIMPPNAPHVQPPLEYKGVARFVGTGAPWAHNCFATNSCVKKSVATASSFDVYTGGPMLHASVMDGTATPTTFGETVASLTDAMRNRGIVMNRKTMKPVGKFNEFVARQSNGQTSAAANFGDFTISAPTGSEAVRWTSEQKSELMRGFAEMAVLEKEMKKA